MAAVVQAPPQAIKVTLWSPSALTAFWYFHIGKITMTKLAMAPCHHFPHIKLPSRNLHAFKSPTSCFLDQSSS